MATGTVFSSLGIATVALVMATAAFGQDVTLDVSDNPCFIAEGDTKCSTTISWQTDPGPGRIAIRIVNHNTSRVWRCPQQGDGSFVFPKVSETPKTIEAYLIDDASASRSSKRLAYGAHGARNWTAMTFTPVS